MNATTLTDRYVDETLRRLPARQRPEIEPELRAAIADAVDDRLETGGDRDEVERAVLTELGDPARLAAGYADRPLQLIGPALYQDYVRMLTTLLATVVPIVAVVIGVLAVVDGDSVGSVVTGVLGTAITTTLHIAFWTTLLFAAVERSSVRNWTPARQWTLAALPEPPSRRQRFGELIGETVGLVVVTSFVLLSPVLRIATDADGNAVGVLSPWLWDTGVVYGLIALVVASLVVSYARYYVRWSAPVAVTGLIVDLASPVVLIWLAASNRMVNPAFIEAVGWPASVQRWINIGLVVMGGLTILHTIGEAVAGYRRRSWAVPDLGERIRAAVDGITPPRR